MTNPIEKSFEIVVIQRPDGNPETIDAGETIAVVGPGGHLSAEKVAPALAALGVQKIPLGTKIRELNGYLRKMQRAFALSSEKEPQAISKQIAAAKLQAKNAGIQVDPENLPIVQKKFRDAIPVLVNLAKKDLEDGAFIFASLGASLAIRYAEISGFSSPELDLLSRCVEHLKAFEKSHRLGFGKHAVQHVQNALSTAAYLSIDIDKSVKAISSKAPLDQLRPIPTPAPPPNSQHPMQLPKLQWRW